MSDGQPDEPDLRTQASRIAARAQILDVRAVSVKADLIRQREASRSLTFSLDTEANVEWEPDDASTFVTHATFRLAVRMVGDDEGDRGENDSDDDDDDDELIARLQFELQGLYSLEMRDGDEPIDESEFEAFGLTTGLFALYPFAREWTRDITGRLGLPPLTLPVMQLRHEGPAKFRKK